MYICLYILSNGRHICVFLCILFNLLMVSFVVDDRSVEIVLGSSRYGCCIFKKYFQKNLQRNYYSCTSIAVFFCNAICVADLSATHQLPLQKLKFFLFCNAFCVAEFGDIYNAVISLQITEFSAVCNASIHVAE